MFRSLECVSVKSVQGKRKYMEDTYRIAKTPTIRFFGVYDGHGGKIIADKLSLNLHLRFFEALKNKLDKASPIEGFSEKEIPEISNLIQKTFLEYDRELFKDRLRYIDPGSTATLVMQILNYVFMVNAGDSRSIHIRNGRVIQQTIDHKPSETQEAERIKKAGGFVWNNRIWGNLAVSRGFGDFDYGKTNVPPSPAEKNSTLLKVFGVGISEKKEANYLKENWVVSPIPDVFAFSIDEVTSESIFVLASDGFWDVFTSEEVALIFIKRRVSANELVQMALNRGSGDNITVMVVG